MKVIVRLFSGFVNCEKTTTQATKLLNKYITNRPLFMGIKHRCCENHFSCLQLLHCLHHVAGQEKWS